MKKIFNITTILFAVFAVLNFLVFDQASAQTTNQKSVSGPVDKRIRTFFYKPDSVYEYTGYYGMPSRIDLDPTEKILTIAMGDTTAWMINPVGFRLFMKPVKFDAQTYMSIITNKRIYYFELYAKELEGLKDPNMVFATRFIYPEGNIDIPDPSGGNEIIQLDTEDEDNSVPDPVADASRLNFNYTISGSKVVSPLEVFDDGEFTYLKFKPVNGDQPAIFQIMPDGNEALINFRITKGYTVIEMVSSRFTLRYGGEIACIYNESMPMEQVVPMKGERDGKKFLGIF